jgi:hypothetical protein
VSYHQQWQHVAENGASYFKVWVKDHPAIRPSEYCCDYCGRDGNQVALLLHRLGAGLQFLADLDKLFPTCSHYMRYPNMFHSWRSSIEENIKNIQPFDARPVSSVDSAMQRYVCPRCLSDEFSHSTVLFCQRSPITSPNEFSDQSVSARCKCWIIKRDRYPSH